MFPYFWKHPSVFLFLQVPTFEKWPVTFSSSKNLRSPQKKTHWSSMAAQRWAKDFCWTWWAFRKSFFFWYNPRPRNATAFATLKNQAIPERKGFVFEASVFLRGKLFQFRRCKSWIDVKSFNRMSKQWSSRNLIDKGLWTHYKSL